VSDVDEIEFAPGLDFHEPAAEPGPDFGAEFDEEPDVSFNGAAPAAACHSWTPLDLLALDVDPPAAPTISGLVYPCRRHVFSGEPETMKTWAAHVLAAEEVRAGSSVLLIDFETGVGATVERLRDLGLTDEEIARFVYVMPSEPLTVAAILADVEALLRARRPSLVVFDAFTGALEIHGFDPNAGREVERFYRTVVGPFQSHGAAVVLLDHVTKDAKTRGRFSIGAERKLGGADVHLGFEVVRPFGRGKSGLARIVTHKDRPGHLARPRAAELELTSNAETGRVTWQIRPAAPADEEHPFRPTRLMEKVSLYVGAHAHELPSRNVVETNVGGKRDYVRQAIDVLLVEEYLAEEDGPRNARLLRSLKPYREADEDDV
jgi:AAA domain